jgi:hypothetical protein
MKHLSSERSLGYPYLSPVNRHTANMAYRSIGASYNGERYHPDRPPNPEYSYSYATSLSMLLHALVGNTGRFGVSRSRVHQAHATTPSKILEIVNKMKMIFSS